MEPDSPHTGSSTTSATGVAGACVDVPLIEFIRSVDENTAGELIARSGPLNPESELARRVLLLVHLHRLLRRTFGDLESAQAWLDTVDPVLKARPRQLVAEPEGVEAVVTALEARSRQYII